MSVFELEPHEQDRWNAALRVLNVDHHAFRWEWRNIFERSFGHQPHYFLAESPEGIGLLPLYYFSSRLFGRALISLPYLNAGGILAQSEELRKELFVAAEALARRLNVSYIELRHAEGQGRPSPLDASRSHKVTMLLDLMEDPEKLFSSFPPKLRSQIRRPTKSGLYAENLRGTEVGSKQIDDFYAVFSEHMRDLGTPVYPRALFQNTVRAFSKESRMLLVRSERKAVAVGLTVGTGPRSEILWASALRSHSKVSPNMLLYWEAIKGAASDGYRVFDFGRSSPDSGTFRFKKQWGAQPQQLEWHYRVFDGDVPDVSPQSAKFQFLVACWKKLPVPLANCIGPYLTRGIP